MSLSDPAGLRAEDLQIGDSIPVADFGQTSLVNVDPGDNCDSFRLALEGSQMPHLNQRPCEPNELVGVTGDLPTRFQSEA